MSRLSELLRQVALKDERLAADLKRETDALAERRAFGLNFERHVPEAVELPGRPVRKNDKVRCLPARGEAPTAENDRLWRVDAVYTDDGQRWADIVSMDDAAEAWSVVVDDLVVVAEFRDPIYPGLVSTGKVERGGPNKPYHAVINAENYHALQALLFTHRGKVNAIYIDPPYNTGAKDWKYNNDYVEGDDLYRHSKWLAMMERRLLLAKGLLNPNNSVLIVTIDEKEYLRLGLLLEQVFPEARIQMVTTVIAPGGSIRVSEFTRVNEFIFFVMLGRSTPVKTDNDMLFTDVRPVSANRSAIWNSLRRRGAGNLRADSPSKFYPVFVRSSDGKVLGAGSPLDRGVSEVSTDPEVEAVLPILPDGREGRWELNRASFLERLAKGYVRAASRDADGSFIVQYLRNAEMERIESGELVSAGLTEQGYHRLDYSDTVLRSMFAKTVWNRTSHDAGTFGSRVVKTLLGNRKFPFPKSLYAVEDTLRFFVANAPDALVVDFFSGSGTTAHAVMRLNKQDGGRRRSISVTNNEVAAEEQVALRQKGLRSGDPEWEQWGICEYITKPRIAAAISGKRPDGKPIAGDYRFSHEFPMADGFAENVEFFTLTYEAPLRVSTNREFAKIAAFLWLRAGSRGRRIGEISAGWEVADVYGVIVDLDQSEKFLKAIDDAPSVTHAFIVTDEDRLFEAMVRQLPAHVEPVRLYEAYLRNFEIEAGRAAR
jgi:adenine-specific DNA-methyltransferase